MIYLFEVRSTNGIHRDSLNTHHPPEPAGLRWGSPPLNSHGSLRSTVKLYKAPEGTESHLGKALEGSFQARLQRTEEGRTQAPEADRCSVWTPYLPAV